MRIRWTTGLDSCTTYKQNCGDACGKHKPGMEIPVQTEEVSGWQIRLASQRRDVERNKSSEVCEPCAEKSRYRFICARTVNRHRWMRRES